MKHILNRLHLLNFKCFEDHTISFQENTIMIGQNNAGKTTVTEALRILGLVCARFMVINSYSIPPEWLKETLPMSVTGIKVSAKAIDTDLEQVFSRYGEPPAIIEAFFSDNIIISIYIHSESELYATFSKNKLYMSSRSRVNQVDVPNVRVLPQIVPLIKDEAFVSTDTLSRNRFSKRTSGNFRNNLLQAKKETPVYSSFQDMIAKTWSSIQINDVSRTDDGKLVYLEMRDTDFVTEIYNMGHGIQMWLQTLWFIASSEPDSIVVLDEPDVYMHADLQRKLVRMLRDNYAQMIIATHSVEIISEVQPENILIINRKEKESIFADGYPVLQTAISSMGSIHNINLSRLLSNKKYLYVEGDDIDILKIFYDTLFPKTVEPLDHLPCVSTGGWGSWDARKENAKQLLADMATLKIYFIYDRDYHQENDIKERTNDAQKNNIRIHIWKRKEIENYTLVYTAIARFLCKKNPTLNYETTSTEINKLISDICNSQKKFIIDKILDERCRKNKKEVSTVLHLVQEEVEKQWEDSQTILKLVPGKEVMARLSDVCKQNYDVSFSPRQIASTMVKSEIDFEIEEYLKQIKEGQ